MNTPYREPEADSAVSKTRLIDRVVAFFAERTLACVVIGLMAITTSASSSGYGFVAILAILAEIMIAAAFLIHTEQDDDSRGKSAASVLWLHVGLLAIIDVILYGA